MVQVRNTHPSVYNGERSNLKGSGNLFPLAVLGGEARPKCHYTSCIVHKLVASPAGVGWLQFILEIFSISDGKLLQFI
jgi:hypothetical protein